MFTMFVKNSSYLKISPGFKYLYLRIFKTSGFEVEAPYYKDSYSPGIKKEVRIVMRRNIQDIYKYGMEIIL